jgi:4-hydroxy-tetrahydrodipicolinate reductase
MNIAIIGYGRMGKTIERIAQSRGHHIVHIHDGGTMDLEALKAADVAIEFTQPEAAAENIAALLTHGIPVVSGTTGWLEHKASMDALAEQHEVGFLYASNFSLGVNLFFVMNEKLATMMHAYPEFKPGIHEIHHTGKKDAPSGTAITAAEGVLQAYKELNGWTMDEDDQALRITADRIDPYFGTHEVHYTSDIDTITFTHEAKSRDGFALGAVMAAEWLPGKAGSFGMRDVLNL